MMTQYDLSVNGYGDDTRGRRMKCGLFVTFVMAMSALNVLQNVFMKIVIFIVHLVQPGTLKS